MFLVCGLAAYLFGKDLNWDLLNYHFYSAHALLNVPLASDFMGASSQRYLNPVAYLPFYWMVSANWPSVLIGLTLSAFHTLNLVLIWYICRQHVFVKSAYPYWLAACATLFAFLSPVFLGILGGTFLDGVTSVLVLAAIAVYCASKADIIKNNIAMFIAGLLCGIAIGLKPTNAIFGLAFFAAALVTDKLRFDHIKSVIFYCIGGTIGAVAVYSPWGFALYKEFGNPFFPLLNQYFESADFPTYPLQHTRFLAQSLGDILSLPLRMLEYRSWVYVENNAPDLRFAAMILMAAIAAMATAWRLKNSRPVGGLLKNKCTNFVIVFFVMAFILWSLSSGNGRYAVPLLLLLGPLLMLFLTAAFQVRKVVILSSAILISAQIFVLVEAGNPRWANGPWTRNWFELDISSRLKSQAFGYISIGTNSHAFIAPFLHPDARISAAVGAIAIDPNGPGGSRIKEFIQLHQDRLRFLIKIGASPTAGSPTKEMVAGIDSQLAQWQIQVDPSDCETIRFFKGADQTDYFLSCRLLIGNKLFDVMAAERAAISPVFDRAELVCPSLFSPAGIYTIKQSGMWMRRYLNTDIVLFSRQDRLYFSRHEYGPFDEDLGTLNEWRHGNPTWACRKLPRG